MTDGAGAVPSGSALPNVMAQELPREGLSWTWDLDVEVMLAALSERAPWSGRVGWRAKPPSSPDSTTPADDPPVPASEHPAPASDHPAPPEMDPVEAEFAEILSAIEEGRSKVVPLTTVAGRVAESLPTGPDLAGWLATGPEDQLEDGALAGVAASYRRLASWAQAGELAAVAELASRSARADERVGTNKEGRPARLSDDACAQVSLALTMSHSTATWWSDLAVTLKWRLPATGAALRSGAIDLGRARAIAEATSFLDDQKARAVEDLVLPAAGSQTMAQLRAALRRAVIRVDPRGAERRRQEAERRAKVMLFPEAEGTASLMGYSLPGVPATAAMARISALARALKASGAGGGIDLLRAEVFLGLLLGTLPYIPPPADGPPDPEPPADDLPGAAPADGPSADGPSADGPAADGPPSGAPAGSEPSEDPADRGARGSATGNPADPPRRKDRSGRADAGPRGGGRVRPPGPGSSCASGPGESGDGRDGGDDEEDTSSARPPPPWPEVPAFLHPGPAAMGDLRPAQGGMLDLALSWGTLIGESAEPGNLGQLGAITPTQARQLAEIATGDPAVSWRVIVVGPDSRALSVGRVRRKPTRAGPAGLVRQITVSITRDQIARDQLAQPPAGLPQAFTRVLSAAERAVRRIDGRAPASSQTSAGPQTEDGCAHVEATAAYRPSPWLREYVAARDQTCRFPTCRQPAWRCDLDHTKPYEQGGRTCDCNLGCLCRFHHQLKQHRYWQLVQPTPGTFTWTTPTGRSYPAGPGSYPA